MIRRLHRLAAPLALLLGQTMLAQPAGAQPIQAQPPGGPGNGAQLNATGNPSALIADEVALLHRVRDKGIKAAFTERADEAAELLVPQRGLAADWLRSQHNPVSPHAGQAQTVWMSCDGSAGITRGTWTEGDALHGRSGWFLRVWRLQKKGGYKWLLSAEASLGEPTMSADFIQGLVSDCPARPRREPAGAPGDKPAKPSKPTWPPVLRPLAGPIPPAPAGDSRQGQSVDGSLAWRSTVQPDGSRVIAVWMWKDGQMAQVASQTIAPGA